jgi:hypothetical protein
MIKADLILFIINLCQLILGFVDRIDIEPSNYNIDNNKNNNNNKIL